MQGLDLLEPRPTGCRTAVAIAQVRAAEPEGAAKLEAALANPDVRSGKIAEFLRLNHIEIGRDTIRIHRLGTCSCAR